MIVLTSQLPPIDAEDAPLSPLNAVWYGHVPQRMILPRLGHLFIVCPVSDIHIACSNKVLDGEHYLLLTLFPTDKPYIIDPLQRNDCDARLLLLLLSPTFIAEMAEFLNLPFELTDLLHAVPLPQGDAFSRVLRLMVDAVHDREQTEELFMEVVGQVLRMLRVRHQLLMNLAQHRENTVTGLMPGLLQARQFIDAHYLEALHTSDIARRAALSEYHFARLFKAAFDITVHQYVLRLRLNHARYLLESSAMSITDVAGVVGYNSLSAFIHAFRVYCGMTPSEYRSRFH